MTFKASGRVLTDALYTQVHGGQWFCREAEGGERERRKEGLEGWRERREERRMGEEGGRRRAEQGDNRYD